MEKEKLVKILKKFLFIVLSQECWSEFHMF